MLLRDIRKKQSYKKVNQIVRAFPTISENNNFVNSERKRECVKLSKESDRTIPKGMLVYHLKKSLILAQDERWRRA